MEQFSEQLNQALTSFVTASKSELEQLKQNLVELNQKCTELEESNEKLTLNDTEQRDLLIRLVREQEGTRERFSSIERTIEKQQRATKEQSRTISLLQAENASLKMALSRSPVVAPNQPLPSRETTSESQEFVSCADASSPRSLTFVGDDVSSTQLPTKSQNGMNGTRSSRHATENVDLPWMKRKRVTFSEDSFVSTGTFKVPQMPTRQSRSNKTRAQVAESNEADNLVVAATATTANSSMVKDGQRSAKRLRNNTTIKDATDEHDPENTIVVCRSSQRPKAKRHAAQSQENIDESMAIDEVRPEYSELLQKFRPRTAAMQAATPLESIDSEISAEPIAFCRGKGGRLRNNPRKSSYFRRRELGQEG